jgi:hypothetical protein
MTEHTNNNTKQDTHAFFKRVENLTNVTFTNDEINLLNKGLKYNLHHKQKNWIQTLAIEADSAVNLLPVNEQNYMRHHIAKNIQKIINKQTDQKDQRITNFSKRTKHEWHTLHNIKHKINQNHLIITKADKGNTIVIMHNDSYNEKNQRIYN